jgi:hypothetical protein
MSVALGSCAALPKTPPPRPAQAAGRRGHHAAVEADGHGTPHAGITQVQSAGRAHRKEAGRPRDMPWGTPPHRGGRGARPTLMTSVREPVLPREGFVIARASSSSPRALSLSLRGGGGRGGSVGPLPHRPDPFCEPQGPLPRADAHRLTRQSNERSARFSCLEDGATPHLRRSLPLLATPSRRPDHEKAPLRRDFRRPGLASGGPAPG